jgi:hypothetical protein
MTESTPRPQCTGCGDYLPRNQQQPLCADCNEDPRPHGHKIDEICALPGCLARFYKDTGTKPVDDVDDDDLDHLNPSWNDIVFTICMTLIVLGMLAVIPVSLYVLSK